MFNLISLDGYFEGTNRDISWHNVDAEFNTEHAIPMLNSVDVLIFGRITYELMKNYWSTPKAINDDPIVANKMNLLPKIVFSKTLDKVDWHNTRLIKNNIEEEIYKLKKQSGKDLIILGSGSIVSQFAQQELIDEFQFLVNPIILGNGTPLFKNISKRLNLKLIQSKTDRSGNVFLRYHPVTA